MNRGKIKVFDPITEYPVRLSDPEHWKIVKHGMAAVVRETEGTAYHYWLKTPYTLAGKSGTAQVFNASKYDKRAYSSIPDALRDHSLFIAFAPYDNPHVAIAVMIEHDASAKPIARQVLDTYFKLYPEAST